MADFRLWSDDFPSNGFMPKAQEFASAVSAAFRSAKESVAGTDAETVTFVRPFAEKIAEPKSDGTVDVVEEVVRMEKT